MPRRIKSALPKVMPLVVKRRAAAFDNSDWLHELKYDGFRALLEIDQAGARLVSRNRNRFKHLDPLAPRWRSVSVSMTPSSMARSAASMRTAGRSLSISCEGKSRVSSPSTCPGSMARIFGRCRSSSARLASSSCYGDVPITSSRKQCRLTVAGKRSWQR
jgi:hypothetical protein